MVQTFNLGDPITVTPDLEYASCTDTQNLINGVCYDKSCASGDLDLGNSSTDLNRKNCASNCSAPYTTVNADGTTTLRSDSLCAKPCSNTTGYDTWNADGTHTPKSTSLCIQPCSSNYYTQSPNGNGKLYSNSYCLKNCDAPSSSNITLTSNTGSMFAPTSLTADLNKCLYSQNSRW